MRSTGDAHTCSHNGVLQLAQDGSKSQCSLVKGFASLLKHSHCEKIKLYKLAITVLKDKGKVHRTHPFLIILLRFL